MRTRPNMSAGIPTDWDSYSRGYDLTVGAIQHRLGASDLGFAVTRTPEYLGKDTMGRSPAEEQYIPRVKPGSMPSSY